MVNRHLNLNSSTELYASIIEHNNTTFGLESNYKKILPILHKIILGELTERQQMCLTLYYFENMNIVDISKKLNINPSTVSRHLTKSRNKLKKLMKYYFNNL